MGFVNDAAAEQPLIVAAANGSTLLGAGAGAIAFAIALLLITRRFPNAMPQVSESTTLGDAP